MLSLDDIHQAISSAINERESSDVSLNISPDVSLNISLEDALQAIETTPRPKTKDCIKYLGTSLLTAIDSAGKDPQNWKLLTLTIIRRRYHAKAPAAKLLKQNKEGSDRGGRGADRENRGGEGHGERLSFYLFCVYLQIMARKDTPSKVFLTQACECLGRLALPAGGTRDVCALVEHLLYDTLNEAGVLKIQKDHGGKRALSQAVRTVVLAKKPTQSESINESLVLEELLMVAAKLLDEDLSLIAKMESDTLTTKKSQDRILQSTINTFIPHRDRGTKARKLVQSVAELMIWSRTASSKVDPKFSAAIQDLHRHSSSIPPASDTTIDDNIIKCVHSLQTSIRRFRKKLNSSSRGQGFSLCSSFTMDPASITLAMIKGSKDGDFVRLSALAIKDIRVMKLIANRCTSQDNAVPISSLSQFRSTWIDAGCEVDELVKLQLQIQCASIKATIDLLRSKIPVRSSGADGKIIIASIDDTMHSDIAAILIATAFDSRCVWDEDEMDSGSDNGSSVTLKIREELCCTSTRSDVMKLLKEAFARFRHTDVMEEETRAVTTKDVQNLIEHVEPGSQVILFASADVQLETRVLEKLQNEKSTIHCHVDDIWSHRLEREKAKVGDITVSLAWENQCDLDLHAICPNGDLISYNRKSGGGIKGGGYLDVDMNINGESMEPVENILFGDTEEGVEAAYGKYKIIVQNYAYHGKTVLAPKDPVSWRVRLSKDGKDTEFTGTCVGTGVESNVTVTEFEYSGRTAPPPEAAGSALVSSSVSGVTSSVGSTMDSLCGLMQLGKQNETINQVQNLVSHTEDEITEDEIIVNEITVNEITDENAETIMVNEKVFNITNRDRLYLNLSALPDSFHAEVNKSFQGGGTLLDHTASQLTKRLIKDGIHIDELRKAGYHDDLISIVKNKMVMFGM